MMNLLLSIIIAIALTAVASFTALELFQGARDSYDQQMAWLRLQPTGSAIKSNIRMIDGVPALPMASTDSTSTYPTVPTWVTANAEDSNGNSFVYCPYAVRPAANMEGTTTTVTGPGYGVVTYSSSLFGTNSPTYVVGSDKPKLYTGTSPAATLTPGATSGYGVTFTAGSSVFASTDVGKTISYLGGMAVITGYTSGTAVKATVLQPFPSTSAIASGSWKKDVSVAPAGLLGFVIAFKPHDTFSTAAAAGWCNGNIKITSSGGYSTTGGSASAASGMVYPIIVGQSQYQQAAAKSDSVTYYVATAATGDSTGRNPSNRTTLDAAMAQIAALRPMRATIYVGSGTHTWTDPYTYSKEFDTYNLRRMTLTIDGTGNSPTINLPTTKTLNLPINLNLKNLTLNTTDVGANIVVQAGAKWIWDGVTFSSAYTSNGAIVVCGTLWLRGTTSLTFSAVLYSGLGTYSGGRVFINGNVTVSNSVNGAVIQVRNGEVSFLPNSTTTVQAGSGGVPITLVGGGKANVSGTLTLQTPSDLWSSIAGTSGSILNANNATINVQRTSGNTPNSGYILTSSEVHLNNTKMLWPNGTASTSPVINTSGIVLGGAGRATLFNDTEIGSSTTASQRPYVGVYSGGGNIYIPGGAFVGGSSDGYTSGADGEGGSKPSNIYVQTTGISNNGYVNRCWDGVPWPTTPASGSAQQRRHLFSDSPEGNGLTSTPRGTTNNVFSTTSTSSLTIAKGPMTLTLATSPTVSLGDQVSIVSSADSSKYMSGYITAISGTSLTVNVTATGGSGTIASWNVAGGLDMRHLVLANQTDWKCNNASTGYATKSLTTPTSTASQGFAAQNVCVSTYYSETVLPQGYYNNTASNISVGGTGSPYYSLDGGTTWSNSASTISPGKTLTIKATPSGSNAGTITPTVTIGGQTTSWTITTNAGCYATSPVQGQVTANGTNVTTLTPTLASNSTASDLILVTVAYYNSTSQTVTVTDDKSNTYAQIGSTNTGNLYTSSFYAKSTTAGTKAITVTFGASVSNAVAIATEYPITYSSPLDANTLTAGTSTVSVTPTVTGELMVGYNAAYASSGISTTFTSPTSNQQTVTSGGVLRLVQSDTNVQTTAPYTVAYTNSGTGVIKNTGGVSFRFY